jgi:hypothetical protein
MPDPIPTDDLYARLGVPADADTPSIDRAWRNLLKQHHPDIAGTLSLQLAKLINVAHDWLSNPDRRARYDAAVHQREGRRTTGSARSRPKPPPAPRRTWPRDAPHRHAAPPDDLDDTFGASAPAIRSFLAQAAALTRDDIDRLAVSESVDPVADLREVIPPELWSRIGALDTRLQAVTPAAAMAVPGAAASARAYGHALVLELFLWYYLADPEPLLEQMRRGWESSVGLPRYGPNTPEVTALIARLRRVTPEHAAALAAAWETLGDPEPWPADAWEFDFAALEVSAALARRDAAQALPQDVARTSADADRWRGAFASTAHVVTLRPIFSPRAYARYGAAWTAIGFSGARRALGEAPRPTVRRA